MSRLLRFVPITLIFSIPLLSQTVLTSDTHWGVGAGPKIIDTTVIVPQGITLTIDSTLQVKFNPSTGLIVAGKIIAAGVTFTSNTADAPGDWNGIEFQATASDSSIFRNDTVSYAGAGANGAGIFYASGAPINISILNCTILYTAGNGIDVGAQSPLIEYTTLQNNTGYAIYSDQFSNFTLYGCTISYNANGVRIPVNSYPEIVGTSISYQNGNGIFIDNGAYSNIHDNVITNNSIGIQLSGSFSSSLKINNNTFDNNSLWAVENTGQSIIDAQYNYWGDDKGPLYPSNPNTSGDKVSDYVDFTPWKTLGAKLPSKSAASTIAGTETWYPDTVYVMNSNVTVSGLLIILPGTIIKAANSVSMYVSGSLIANGTSDSSIVFTSLKDDAYGGDTNGDSTQTEPLKGDWDGVQLYTSAGSSLKYCLLQYGGYGYYYGNLYISSCTPVISHVYSTNSSTYGISVYYSTVVFDTVTVSGNGSDGINVSDGNLTFRSSTVQSNAGNGIYITGSSADVKVRNSVIGNNGYSGLYAYYGSTFSEVSNCVIQGNVQHGIVTENGALPQIYINNQIKFNGMDGLRLSNPSLNANEIQLNGNIITDNGSVGAVTTACRFIANTFMRNKYPLGVWGKLGNIYSGNTISQNTFNNAIALVGEYPNYLKDTLTAVLPAPITAYHVITYIGVNNGDTLVIQPGTKIKFVKSDYYGFSFDINGTLIAEGTQAQPIIFTSWRDSTAGGKTTEPGDNIFAEPGDWDYIQFYYGSSNSRVRYCEFRYGGSGSEQVSFNDNLSTMVFSHNTVAYSYGDGIGIYSTPITLDNCTVVYNNGVGVSAYYFSEYLVGERKGKKEDKEVKERKGVDRMKATPAGEFIGVMNSLVAYNQSGGLRFENNTAPLYIVNGRFINNNGDGVYVNSLNDAVDTLIYIDSTTITGNYGTGVFSSRAYLSNDSISGNLFGMGLTGQLSLTQTGNELGNVYSNTYVRGNVYDSVIVCEGYVEGNLGYSFPPGHFSKIFTNKDYIYVDYGKTLTIAPGTIFKFLSSGGEITVYGKILAEGEFTNKIIFTSWKDDSYGGDTNNDTTSTIPQPGDWYAIYLEGSDTSHFSNAIIKYAGSYGLFFSYDNSMIDSSTVAFTGGYGIYVNNGSPAIFANDIHHNEKGIYIYGASNPLINYNNIDSNTYGLYADYVENIIDATNNYWGSASGPFKNTGSDTTFLNPLGEGNEIYVYGTGDVNWKPALPSRQGLKQGDASLNGEVSAYDASLVLQHDVEIDTLSAIQQLAADVDGNNTVNSNDASFILQYVVGLINGFPGKFGKQVLEADALSAFSFQIEKSQQPDQFDLVIRLNKPVNIYSASVKLVYDTSLVMPLSMTKGESSDSMMLAHYFPKGKANVALAGVHPLNEPGVIARFTFKLENAGRAKETILFTVNKFLLNGIDVTKDAGNVVLDVKKVIDIPTTFALGQNYPNPFNPATTIKYQLPEESRVTITIYNMLGQRVRTLVNDLQREGYYTLQWNGSDESGRSVASGVYIYRIEAVSPGNRKFVSAKKMILLK